MVLGVNNPGEGKETEGVFFLLGIEVDVRGICIYLPVEKHERSMKQELPKIDIPVDLIAGTIVGKDILNLYTNYPCRLKAQVFAFCLQGGIEASIDLARFKVKPLDFVSIVPGSILQIHKVEEDVKLYFLGFSSEFMRNIHLVKEVLDIIFELKQNPVVSLETEHTLLEEYFRLLINLQKYYRPDSNKEVVKHVLLALFYGLGDLYKQKTFNKAVLGKSEKISKDFWQLVIRHYTHERNVAFYAEQLGITSSHLSATVKQATGKTCLNIISEMVIIDAKAQLKSTDLPIHEIAYSLNFTNMSFFGKYFKRYAGIGPLEYRNS